MNHDYAHCADYKEKICPKECFRGQLTKGDLGIRPELLYCSYKSFKGTEECPLKEQTDGNDDC